MHQSNLLYTFVNPVRIGSIGCIDWRFNIILIGFTNRQSRRQDLKLGQCRILETDNNLILPINK